MKDDDDNKVKDDDQDFSFGQFDDDFGSDDGWGKFDAESGGDFTLADEPADDSRMDDGKNVQENFPGKGPLSHDEAEVPRAKPALSSSRMIYYGALVMLLSAVGFYYFASSPMPPGAQPKVEPLPSKQTLEMPERPEGDSLSVGIGAAQQVAEGQVAVSTEVPRGTLKEIPPAVGPETQPLGSSWTPGAAAPPQTPAPAEAQARPTESGKAEPPVRGTVVTAKETVQSPPVPAKSPSPAPAKPAPEKIVLKKPAPASAPASTAAVGGPYLIQAGAYGETTNRDRAMAKIKALGYEAQVTPLNRTLPVTRLLIGVYPPETARAKAKELEPMVPKNFTLPRGEGLALYAGSYTDSNKAQAAVQALAARGVTVTEERAEVETTLWRVSFGGFADKAQAEKVAVQARAAGLEARVLRNP
ncbi:MAG: SPOR domain-containing protein [Trichloromonas sp.]|jgi:cell division protein FtsN|nr:SPOR domain-containing protein [Trichloromonas sp.]